MSTRGAVGFVVDGEEKITYNHFDSYPECLGLNTLGIVNELAQDIPKTFNLAKNIEMIASDDPASDDLHAIEGELDKYLVSGKMVDNKSFMLDSLFCEWAYLMNLDTNMFEIYRGFNTTPNEILGRYATKQAAKYSDADYDNEYYGVILVKEYRLDNLPSDVDFLNDLTPQDEDDQ